MTRLAYWLVSALCAAVLAWYPASGHAATTNDGGTLTGNAAGTSWTYSLAPGALALGAGSSIAAGAGGAAAGAEYLKLMQTIGVQGPGGSQLMQVTASRGITAAAVSNAMASAALVGLSGAMGYEFGQWLNDHGIQAGIAHGLAGGFSVDQGALQFEVLGSQWSFNPGREDMWAGSKSGACALFIADWEATKSPDETRIAKCSDPGPTAEACYPNGFGCVLIAYQFHTRTGLNKECPPNQTGAPHGNTGPCNAPERTAMDEAALGDYIAAQIRATSLAESAQTQALIAAVQRMREAPGAPAIETETQPKLSGPGSVISGTKTSEKVAADGSKVVTQTQTKLNCTYTSSVDCTKSEVVTELFVSPSGASAAGTTTTTTQDGTTTTTTDTPGICELYPNISACKELGTPQDVDLPTKDIPAEYAFDTGWGPSAGYCPDHTVSYLGQSIKIDLVLVCDFFVKIRPAVIACAAIASAFIFIGAIRRG